MWPEDGRIGKLMELARMEKYYTTLRVFNGITNFAYTGYTDINERYKFLSGITGIPDSFSKVYRYEWYYNAYNPNTEIQHIY